MVSWWKVKMYLFLTSSCLHSTALFTTSNGLAGTQEIIEVEIPERFTISRQCSPISWLFSYIYLHNWLINLPTHLIIVEFLIIINNYYSCIEKHLINLLPVQPLFLSCGNRTYVKLWRTNLNVRFVATIAEFQQYLKVFCKTDLQPAALDQGGAVGPVHLSTGTYPQ